MTHSERLGAQLARIWTEHALFSALLLQLVPDAASPKEAAAALIDWRELESATWDHCTRSSLFHVRHRERGDSERPTVAPRRVA